MTNSWDLVNYYRTTPGVVHKKSGWVLAKITSTMRLERLMDEVIELIGAPHDLEEMADVCAILFHHVQAEGYSMAEFENCIADKLRRRLEVPGFKP